MDVPSSEELDAFLIEAELVKQKVDALANNRMSPEEFDRIEAARQQDRRRREEYRLRKQNEAEEIKRRGTSGKGISKDFKHFCRACHLEYVYETPKCLKCERPTMTLEERQKQLTEMVDDYKSKKLHREERKHKWDMWKKTKSMLWKKEAINYSKWDVYTDSEDEAQPESEPVVPKDDPNFKALQMDMQERKKKREEDTKRANALKDKGNEAIKANDYEKAVQHYTFALDYAKDIKAIYTNRALAYIKLKKYSKAIKDCNNVIDYITCFEKLSEVPDLAFKAYSRKAQAHKERKEYKEALDAITEALKLYPADKSGIDIKKEVENFIKHEEATEKLITREQERKKAESNQEGEPPVKTSEAIEEQIIKQLAEGSGAESKPEVAAPQPIKVVVEEQKIDQTSYNKDPLASIKRTLARPNKVELQFMLNLLLSQPDYKTALVSLGGIKKLLQYISAGNESSTATLLICHTMDANGVVEKEVWDFGIGRLEQQIQQLLKRTLKIEEYSRLEDLFEILVTLSQSEKYRTLLATNRPTIDFLLQSYPVIITKFKKEMQLVTSFVVYCSNLCMGDSILKNELEKHLQGVLASLSRIIETQSKKRRFIDMQKSCYNFISNLLTKESIRDTIGQNMELLGLLSDRLKAIPKSNEDFKETVVALLSLFANLTFQPKKSILEKLEQLKLHDTVYSKFVEGAKISDSLRLGLQVLSKLQLQSVEIKKPWIDSIAKHFGEESMKASITSHALRLFNNVYVSNPKTPAPSNLDQMALLLNLDNNEVLFCNTCTLLGVMINNEETSEKVHTALHNYVVRLITVAKDKTGNMRKSSAILLAKIARHDAHRELFIANHGMDVLKSVAHLVLEKS